MNIKELIEKLSIFPDDSIIVDSENRKIKHISNISENRVTVSFVKKIGLCTTCGNPVFPTIVEDYTGVCTNCDENKYKFEILDFK